MLLLEAIDVLSSFSAAPFLTQDAAAVFAASIVHFATDIAVLAAYLAFMALALDTPLVRPLRGRAAPIILALIAVGAMALVTLNPYAMGGPSTATGYRPAPWETELGPSVWTLWATMAVVFTYGLIAAIDAWLRSGSPTARSRAGTYLLAFGARDAGWMVVFAILTYWGLGGVLPLRVAVALPQVYAGVLLVYVALLAYGILRHQVLDIDLKLKWTLERGTVAAALTAAFFVVKEGVEFLLPLEGLVPSLAGAALVAALAYPAWRGAARLTERIMPGIEDTPQYRKVRGREIYRAALEELAVGGLSAKEHRALEALRTRLGIPTEDAEATEQEVRQALRAKEA